jgi:hypothetical protein
MIVAYLQSQNIPKHLSSGINLGKLLLDFLGFYAQFDAENTGIFTAVPSKK